MLYRTNGQSRPFEEAFRARGIRYEVVGGSEFFDRREVRDVLAYLKLLANPADEVSLLRIVNVPARGIGDVTVEHLVAHARARGLTLADVLASPASVPELTPGAARAAGEFSGLIHRTRARLRTEPLSAVTRGLLHEIGFEAAARASTRSATAVERKLRGVEGILASLEQFERREGARSDLRSYLNRLSLDTREEEDGPSPRPGHPPHPARRQGPGIQDGLPRRHGGRVPAARGDAGRAPEPRGGAAALLRGPHPGP